MLLTAIRTIILFSTVTIVMRIMGKRQVGEMQPYELVVAVLIAELAAIPMEDTDIPLINGLVPIVVLLVVQVALSELALFSERARKVICGTPSVLISQGEIREQELRKLRVNLHDLLEQLRNKDFPNVKDIAYAILETNGQLSVIPKAGLGPVTAEDLDLEPPSGGLPVNLILDGLVNVHNLRQVGLSLDELTEQAKQHGAHNLRQVFFANIDETGHIHMQLKQEKAGEPKL